MIDYIYQPAQQNILIIRYISGATRYAYLEDWGNYKLSKTQREFLDKATAHTAPDTWTDGNNTFYYKEV